ncbi:MAG: deoxyribodipyrimidine photo-lyase [Lewinella sp.]|nr:deoxyribodipyrimidine photo-lyase [Lewinella sp.]
MNPQPDSQLYSRTICADPSLPQLLYNASNHHFWHRRDLRTYDNAALYHALAATKGSTVLPIFIFDRHILDPLTSRTDARVEFIHRSVLELGAAYAAQGSALRVFYGHPETVWAQLLQQHPELQAVYTNADYEPYALNRDQAIRQLLDPLRISFYTYKITSSLKLMR